VLLVKESLVTEKHTSANSESQSRQEKHNLEEFSAKEADKQAKSNDGSEDGPLVLMNPVEERADISNVAEGLGSYLN
jgi:hypothetical protein